MPASELLLTTFIADHVGTVKGGTIKSWMSGIKAWHEGKGAKWNGNEHWVQLARRTAYKLEGGTTHPQRALATTDHLIVLYGALNMDSPFDAAVWAIATAAFWGCHRLGELTIPSHNGYNPLFHVSRTAGTKIVRSSTVHPATSIHIPWTKST
ncbi:hypothetical protein C8F01DRAFT_1004678, partial [Mycena amicta]